MEVKTLTFFLTVLLVITVFINNTNCKPVIQMGNTQIVGKSVQFMDCKVNQYLSIPYAKPPTGDLRFQKTVPLRRYPDVLYATRVPPACMQYTQHPFPWYINSTHKSEDCLYLNIWTPGDASPENKKAVMYWIHGGGFRYGSIQDKLYSGIPLAALGDVIVVTMNYRLGVFGFLTSGTADASGNAGLWDVLEGLKWVNKNIACFGGDPSRITVAGESTGANIVTLLSVSPLARGLYRRQIIQSGIPTELLARETSFLLSYSQQTAKVVGCATDDFTIENNPEIVVKCLKEVDPIVLSKADFAIEPRKTTALVPRFGDDFLPTDPTTALFSGNFSCTEVLIGNTRDEGSFLITVVEIETFGFFGEKNTFITKEDAQNRIRVIFQNISDPEAAVYHYLPVEFPEDYFYGIRHQLQTSMGDKMFVCPSVYHAEHCANKGCQVYYYFFIHRPSTSPWASWMGVAHYTELEFTFGQPLLNPSYYEPEEIELSERMIEIWSSFIRDGKPSIAWPLYSRKNQTFKYLGPGVIEGRNGIGPHKCNCEFYRPYFEPR